MGGGPPLEISAIMGGGNSVVEKGWEWVRELKWVGVSPTMIQVSCYEILTKNKVTDTLSDKRG